MKIRQFEVSLQTGVSESKETVVTKYEPPAPKKQGRVYNTNIRQTYGTYLEKAFYENEFLAYEKKAKTNDILKRDFLEAHNKPLALVKQFQRYQVTIGSYRHKYNIQKIHSRQDPLYLLSFQYDTLGIIVVDGRKHGQYLYFEEAYARCLKFKIGDPRFIAPDILERIRDRKNSNDPKWIDWSVPSLKWVKHFRTRIRNITGNPQLEEYNSVYFPAGWTREETPSDMDL